MRHVSIDSKCLVGSLIPAAIELYSRETSGYLIGGNGGSRMKVLSAYSIQSDNKRPSYVEHGNFSAINRVEGCIKSMRLNLIGGFHTHPGGPNKLSRSDVRFLEDKVEVYSLKRWLELILSVKKKAYSTKHKPGLRIRRYDRKLGFTVKPDPYTGFEITVSGFWLKANGKGLSLAGEAVLYTGRSAG